MFFINNDIDLRIEVEKVKLGTLEWGGLFQERLHQCVNIGAASRHDKGGAVFLERTLHGEAREDQS